MISRSQRMSICKSMKFGIRLIAASVLLSSARASFCQEPPGPGPIVPSPHSNSPDPTYLIAKKEGAGTTIQIKKELTGDFTYRFVTDKDQTSAPAPLPAPA